MGLQQYIHGNRLSAVGPQIFRTEVCGHDRGFFDQQISAKDFYTNLTCHWSDLQLIYTGPSAVGSLITIHGYGLSAVGPSIFYKVGIQIPFSPTLGLLLSNLSLA